MRALAAWFGVVVVAGCAGDKGGPGGGDGADDTGAAWRPDVLCPGDASCPTNDGPLQAGVARRDITPTCFERWDDVDGNGTWARSTEAWFDCGCHQLCPGDAGYTAADAGEGDGVFQAVWIAGFGQSRPANGVHDPIDARVVVVSSGETSVALVSLDVVGWFYDDALRIREAVAAAGAPVDHVVVHASHNHEGPDSMGQWGAALGQRGVDDAWQADVVAAVADAVAEAAANQVPVTARAGSIDTAAPYLPGKGSRNTVRDSRDPVVIDELLSVLHLADEGGATVATLINWGNHPEVLGGQNTLLTSDFVHYLRRGVEEGVGGAGGRPGVGGMALFLNASVGGLMTPLSITVTGLDGVDHSEESFEKAQALGEVMADLALQAVGASAPLDAPRVEARAARFFIPVENFAFQALFLIGVFDREIYNYDPDRSIDATNTPDLLSEVGLVSVGGVRMLTIPGELAPELAIGGYDGSKVHSDEVPFLDPGNDHPPAVANAPAPPYLKDQMGGSANWIIGLGNDEIGYLIPPYDYVLDETTPYLVEAPGDHYEETNSVGPSAVPRILEVTERLLAY